MLKQVREANPREVLKTVDCRRCPYRRLLKLLDNRID